MKDKSAYILTNKDRTNPYQLVAYDYVVSEDGMIQKKRVSLGYFSNQIKANKERVAANKKYPSPLTFICNIRESWSYNYTVWYSLTSCFICFCHNDHPPL